MNNDLNKQNAVNETDFGSKIGPDARAPHQSSNEGGTFAPLESTKITLESDTPRLVTRGESYEIYDVKDDDGESFVVVVKNGRPKAIKIPQPKTDGNPNAAIVDFLNCTFQIRTEFTLHSFFQRLFQILGKSFAPAQDRCIGKVWLSALFHSGR